MAMDSTLSRTLFYEQVEVKQTKQFYFQLTEYGFCWNMKPTVFMFNKNRRQTKKYTKGGGGFFQANANGLCVKSQDIGEQS